MRGVWGIRISLVLGKTPTQQVGRHTGFDLTTRPFDNVALHFVRFDLLVFKKRIDPEGILPCKGLFGDEKTWRWLKGTNQLPKVIAGVSEAFPIFGQAAAAVEPRDGALDDPSLWQNRKSFDLIRSLDDFSFDVRRHAGQLVLESCALIGGVGKELLQKGMQPEHCGEQQDAAIAVLDAGGMNDGVQQQAQRIYENVALLAFDLLARIIAMRINPGPPFSALFTLWLSITAAVGLACRPLCSRHST